MEVKVKATRTFTHNGTPISDGDIFATTEAIASSLIEQGYCEAVDENSEAVDENSKPDKGSKKAAKQ